MSGDIRTKRIYEPAAAADGTRVLVDRVWPRGVTKEEAALDLWLKDVAPTTALRKWFGHKPERWEEFVRRYHHELNADSDAVTQLRHLAARGPLTLLYGARDEEHNNAVALAAYIREKGRRHD